VNQIITMLSAGTFDHQVDGKPVDVGTLLHQAADDVRPFVQIRHQTLDVDVAPGIGGMRHLIRRRCATASTTCCSTRSSSRPTAADHARRPPREWPVEIRIADNGVGMDAETLGQLFRPFFTSFDVSHHSSGQYEFCRRGLGLGLSVVKAFVDLHGGSIRAESESGKGTTIVVTLPDSPSPPSTPQPATTAAQPVAVTT
jgi:light-regulated signal transduction histidine kinase (bacteriophytochrome)